MADPVAVDDKQRVNWRDLPPVGEDEQPRLPDDFTPSQTFLRTMDACDRAALLYLTYRGGGATHELNRGSLVHLTIDRLLRMLLQAHRERAASADPTGVIPEYEVDPLEHAEHLADQLETKIPPELGREVLLEAMHDNPELQVSAEERDACRYMVDHWCRGTEIDPSTILGVEKTLTLETGGYRVLIRPDVLLEPEPGLLEIIDWKTAWPPDSEQFRAQAYDQQGRPRWAGNYQLNMGAVVAAFGISDDGLPLGNFERFRLSLRYPRILRDDGLDERVIEVDRLQVQAFRDDLDLQLRRLREVCIGERKWQATVGNHCDECPAEVACPLPRYVRPEAQMASLDSIDDLEEASTTAYQMGRRAERLKRRVKKAAQQLDPLALETFILDDDNGTEVNGVRVGKDVAFVFVDSTTTEVDREGLLAAAEEAAKTGEVLDRSKFEKTRTGVSFKKRTVLR